jgi:hypothetical protein
VPDTRENGWPSLAFVVRCPHELCWLKLFFWANIRGRLVTNMHGHHVHDAEQPQHLVDTVQQGAQAEQFRTGDLVTFAEPTSGNVQPLALIDAEHPGQQQSWLNSRLNPDPMLHLVLRLRVPKWQVKFPKTWYDIDWWYSGHGYIQELIENAYATQQETVIFEAVTHAEPTQYEINLRSRTQRNLTTGRIRQIRRIDADAPYWRVHKQRDTAC